MKNTIKLLCSIILLSLSALVFWYVFTHDFIPDYVPTESVIALPPEHESVVVTEPSGVVYSTDQDGNETAFGDASWYSWTFNGDGSTRTCQRNKEDCWSDTQLVAASRDFKRWSTVRVTNLSNLKYVDVLIDDYGPDESEFPERIIDLSSMAFAQIADLSTGVVFVKVEWPVPIE